VKKRRQDRSPDQPPINPSIGTREIRPESVRTAILTRTNTIYGVWKGAYA